MAKKRTQTTEDSFRQTRKEILIARKQARQTRQIRLAVSGVAGLIILVFLIAFINEFIVAPNRATATVNGEEIALREWQERVRYERAQRILLLENQLEAFGGDVGIIQQFGGQMILELQDAESLAQGVLDQMINEEMMRQMAEARGITVTEADVDEAIGESFNYFGGGSPTPVPTATETVVPTPSVTPVPADGEEVFSTPLPTPTTGPTATPLPTATPVSEEVFREQLDELLDQYRELGVDESTFRSAIRAQLYQERLMDALAEENNLPEEAEQVSLFVISVETEQAAAEILTTVEEGDFLSTWNRFRSAPAEAVSLETAETPADASELLWRTPEDLASILGEEVAEAAFNLPLNETSEVIERQIDAETSRFYIIQVSGREVRPLSESAVRQDKVELLTSIIEQQLTGNLESTEFWRNRVPSQPVLDPKFLAPPTPTPPLPAIEGDEEGFPLIATPAEGS